MSARRIPPLPPVVGDLILMVRPPDEPPLAGWTTVPNQPGMYWRHATGQETSWPPLFAIVKPGSPPQVLML